MVLHGTNNLQVSQNVAYDAVGMCFYLEDGVEEENVIEYNLAAHIHFMEYPVYSSSQFTDDYPQTEYLNTPVDITAAGFYITNAYNYIRGNAASGGWAGRPMKRMLIATVVPWVIFYGSEICIL